MSGCFTQSVVRALDAIARKILPADDTPQHLRTGRRGEEDVYFHLRRQGYVIVARNFRSPLRRGEIDLIGWDHDVLCFIEVKTRTTHDVKPAEAAVDRAKQQDLSAVAREYLRRQPWASHQASRPQDQCADPAQDNLHAEQRQHRHPGIPLALHLPKVHFLGKTQR